MPNLRSEVEFNDPSDDIFENKERLREFLKDVVFRLNTFKRDITKTDVEGSVTNVTVRSGGNGGGGGSSVASSLTQQHTATVGPNTIPIPSPGLPSGTGTDYIVFAILVGSAGEGAMLLGQPDVKNTNSFTYSDIVVAGVIYFDVKPKA